MTQRNTATPANKIALVTGGSRGLGRNIVLSLAGRGVDSIFTYFSIRPEAEEVVGLAAEAGRKAIALQLDIANVCTLDQFVERVRTSLAEMSAGRFDYLVNNAGIPHHNAFEQTSEEELDQLYNVNFKGVFFLTQKLLPLLNDGGRIVNLSSVDEWKPIWGRIGGFDSM
jgi:NAD(P)-dependent dehydrogenase (short-subunit alcohol dehydrogenase family)